MIHFDKMRLKAFKDARALISGNPNRDLTCSPVCGVAVILGCAACLLCLSEYDVGKPEIAGDPAEI
jgi:hypothetical protein